MQNLKRIALAVLVLASLFAVGVQAETAVAVTSEAVETVTSETVTSANVTSANVEIEATSATETATENLAPTALEIELGIRPGPIYNPCYQYDNPSIGCYRTWSPQTLCCLSNGKPGCFDLCF